MPPFSCTRSRFTWKNYRNFCIMPTLIQIHTKYIFKNFLPFLNGWCLVQQHWYSGGYLTVTLSATSDSFYEWVIKSLIHSIHSKHWVDLPICSKTLLVLESHTTLAIPLIERYGQNSKSSMCSSEFSKLILSGMKQLAFHEWVIYSTDLLLFIQSLFFFILFTI